MSVKYVKGPGGKFRGSLPNGKSTTPAQPFSTDVLPLDNVSLAPGTLLDDAWAAFEQSKKTTSEDPILNAQQSFTDYRERVDNATSQDDLYEAQEIYHQEIASIPLGNVNVDISEAWDEYQSINNSGSSPMISPSTEPHGWLVVVAAQSENSKALEQVWQAANYIDERASELDPRLETVDAARLQLLEFNSRTPSGVFEDAYSAERLDRMKGHIDSDYVDHLVRLPVDRYAVSRKIREDVASRICEWADMSADNAEDVDDATIDASGVRDGADTPLIPVLMTDIDAGQLAKYRNSASQSIAASVRAAEAGYRLVPTKI